MREPLHYQSNSDARTVISVIATAILIKIALFLWVTSHFDFSLHKMENWLSIWDRWDCRAYKTIASEGYNAPTSPEDYRGFLVHFPPIYPITIYVFSRIFSISVAHAGFLVSFFASVASSYYLYKLALIEFADKRTAYTSVILLNVYPTSYFGITIYSESLFLLLTILSFYLLRKDEIILAGLSGGVAILTRLSGVVILPVFLYYIFKKIKGGGAQPCGRYILLIGLPILACLLYLLLNLFYYGDPFFFQKEYAINPYSAKHLILPLRETAESLIMLFTKPLKHIGDQHFMMTMGWGSILTLLALIATAWGIQKVPFDYTLYSIGSVLFFSSYSWGISNARYTYAVFPLFLVLARIKNTVIIVSILFFSVVLLLHFSKLFTGGTWAF